MVPKRPFRQLGAPIDFGLNCNYIIIMRIVWDEPKRLANLARHGMDFADLDETFFEGSVIVPAKLGRQNAIGRHRNGIILVVFVALGTEVSASSACDRQVERNGD